LKTIILPDVRTIR